MYSASYWPYIGPVYGSKPSCKWLPNVGSPRVEPIIQPVMQMQTLPQMREGNSAGNVPRQSLHTQLAYPLI